MAREILAGIVIGLALASITGPLVFWHWSHSRLALSVGVSVSGRIIDGHRSRDGPSVGLQLGDASPRIWKWTTGEVIQDLLSIWIYLSVTALVM